VIFLFTDFGREGPYLGQVEAVIARRAPAHRIIELCSDVSAFAAQWAAYLLPAYASIANTDDIVVAVIDPGVGSDRAGVVLEADGRWFVGPDNGLLALVARRATRAAAWRVPPPPPDIAATFHGRDVFAPMAAEIANHGGDALSRVGAIGIPATTLDRPDWPDDLGVIVYVDRFGNAMTGLRGTAIPGGSILTIGGHRAAQARTFNDVPVGDLFWYVNSNGLVEVAVNCGRASDLAGVKPGATVAVERP